MTIINWSEHPPYIYVDYKSSTLRGPRLAPIAISCTGQESSKGKIVELAGGLRDLFTVADHDHDLIRNGQQNGLPLGERIIVSGRVLNQWGKPEPGLLIEAWQANASGRYAHKIDQQDAPLDPNFLGVGRCITDREGGYRFYTIKPGAYPWKNHHNAWRPPHIHFSIVGDCLADRLVTQMYFPQDPLLALDPIFTAVPNAAKERLISTFDLSITEPDFALGYHFDMVIAGANATPMEDQNNSQVDIRKESKSSQESSHGKMIS